MAPAFLPLRHALILLGLILLPLACLGQVVAHDFVHFDDPPYVSANPHVNTGLSWDNFYWAWTNADLALWHPMTYVSFQLDATLFGNVAWGYHLSNLVWHCLNVLLLYGWLYAETGAVARSALVAALFAVHPMHVESVAWIIERKDVLSGFFALCTLWAYLRYTRHETWGNYALVTLCLFLGLASKVMLVTWPFVLLLVDCWPLKRLQPIEPGWRPWLTLAGRRIREKIPWILLGIGCGLLLLYTHGDTSGRTDQYPWIYRWSNAIFSLGWYLAKTVWPSNLAAFYPQMFLPLTDWTVVLSGFVLLGIVIFLAWVGPRRPEQLVGWFWFFGMLVPVLGFIPGDNSRADRWLYLPHIGLFIALVWGIADLLQSLKAPTAIRLGLASTWVLALTVATWFQAGFWKNDETLWLHTLEVTGPANNRANSHLAIYYYLKGEKNKAFYYSSQAFLHPIDSNRGALLHGILLSERGRFEEAIPYLQKALAWDEKSYAAHYNLGLALFQVEQYPAAARHWLRALELQQGTPELYHGLGAALVLSGQHEQAIGYLRQALAARPDMLVAHFHLGLAFARQGNLQDARVHLTQAQQDPNIKEEAHRELQKLEHHNP
jgi:Tfp pilus assembly protein PilF